MYSLCDLGTDANDCGGCDDTDHSTHPSHSPGPDGSFDDFPTHSPDPDGCDDSCTHAFDGMCDEDGHPNAESSACAFGTDAFD